MTLTKKMPLKSNNLLNHFSKWQISNKLLNKILLNLNLRLNMNMSRLFRASLRSLSSKRQSPSIGEVLVPRPSLDSQMSRKERWKSVRILKQSVLRKTSSLISSSTKMVRCASLAKTDQYSTTATSFASFKLLADASMNSDATRPNYCVTSVTWSQATRRRQRNVVTRTGHITRVVFVKVATRRYTTRLSRTQKPMRPTLKT